MMAGLNVCKILLLVLGVLTQHGFGATLDLTLTVTPTKTSQLSPEDVFMSCRPGTSLQAKNILLIKITKSGDSSPLASVYHKQQAEVYNPNTNSRIKVIGHIDNKALLESFLTIKLEDPTYKQSGSYKCELTYLDVKGQMKVAKISGDVKVTKPDIIYVDGVIDDVREDVETNSQDLESVTKELDETKAGLKSQTSSTGKLLKAVTKELNKTKAELNSQTSSTGKLLKAVTKELHETKAELNSQTSYTSSLSKVIKDLEKKMETNAKHFESVTKELQETIAKLQKTCPDNSWTQVGYNWCYKGHKTEVSWQKAKETCRKEGGTLVSIHSKFQNDMAKRAAKSAGIPNTFWIGLNDIAEEGKFMFDDGTKMSSYTNWFKGEPNNLHGNEDCVVQVRDDKIWNDYGCGINLPFVCQTSTRTRDF